MDPIYSPITSHHTVLQVDNVSGITNFSIPILALIIIILLGFIIYIIKKK
jgi:hypothetical protein